MRKASGLAILATLLLAVGTAGAGEWQVDKKAKGNLVKFTSEVVALTFDGTTDKVDGFIYWEGEKIFEKKSQLRFEVDLNSLDTGIGKRDRDMRNVLKTDKHPKAVFVGRITSHAPMDTSVTAYRVKAKGKFSIHGVEKDIEIPGVVFVEEGRSKVQTDFTIRLEDYNIEAPSLAAFVKVNEEVAVHATVHMKHKK